ncbi:MarR family transcriptional regulator [Aeromicrobium camelliae]|uniref:MarR family transcriptional regulator n=1 Tax=Aeromicrobium camelliae TaxID=1538144 RepID=A0A3N6X0N4_9ACTN|nr:MarR family transcriptional regulator [Aeromicrobium camelliae]RQN07685.1 MarR family transcriptional regulator [Aeromicrobium camelliae]
MPTDSQRLALAVARLNRRLRQERQSDLTPTQLSVLGTLAKIGPATPGAIAARERVRPPSITRTLNQLVECGYATKTPSPDDGRQVLVALADRGERILDDERQRRDAWLEHQLSELDREERELLRRAVPILTRLAEAE